MPPSTTPMSGGPARSQAVSARRWPWIGAAAVVALALVAAVVLSGGADDDRDGEARTGPGGTTVVAESAPVAITGSALPALGQGADRALGMTAPTVVGTSFDGSAMQLKPGRPTLVLFLAHWCPHCQAEVPVLVEHMDDEGVPSGVDVIAVATSTTPDRPNYPPSAWLEEEGWPTPVLLDSTKGEVAAAFGLPGFPFIVALDASGKVVARQSGEFSAARFEALAALARR